MKNNAKILICDENPEERAKLSEKLYAAGYAKCDSAADGERALEMIEKGEYDIVITDLWLSGIDGIGMITHITAAIRTTDKTAEDMLSCILFLRCSAFCLCRMLLYRFPSITVNNRLVNIPEDFPILHWIINTGFVLEVFGIGLKVDNITTVFLLAEYFLNSSFTPLVARRCGTHIINPQQCSL